MLYLESFRFPSPDDEEVFLNDYFYNDYQREEYYHRGVEGLYPFKILSNHYFHSLDFEPITILYGGNGSGKSTALNVIASALKLKRNAAYNKTIMMDRYVEMCQYELSSDYKKDIPSRDIASISKIITSDDVFKEILSTRDLNDRKMNKSKALWNDIEAVKNNRTQRPREVNFLTGEGFKEINNYSNYQRKSFVRNLLDELGELQQEYSNGENGMRILAKAIEEDGLYLLDEPENSMSCSFQKTLAQIIQLSVKSGKTQFIIATHAPFLLALQGAKIYNLDADPVTISQWWELRNMQQYYELFSSYSESFEHTQKK